MLDPGPALSQQVTADLAIGTAGRSVVIWSITIQSGTTATITIRDGDEVTDAVLWGPNAGYTPAATVPPAHFSFPNGLFCPNGAFADVGGSPVIDITYNHRRAP